jgi:hypothetical protein
MMFDSLSQAVKLRDHGTRRWSRGSPFAPPINSGSLPRSGAKGLTAVLHAIMGDVAPLNLPRIRHLQKQRPALLRQIEAASFDVEGFEGVAQVQAEVAADVPADARVSQPVSSLTP